MKLTVTKEQSRSVASFRRSPQARVVREVLENNLQLFRDRYELSEASEEKRMDVIAAKNLINALFEAEMKLEGTENASV